MRYLILIALVFCTTLSAQAVGNNLLIVNDGADHVVKITVSQSSTQFEQDVDIQPNQGEYLPILLPDGQYLIAVLTDQNYQFSGYFYLNCGAIVCVQTIYTSQLTMALAPPPTQPPNSKGGERDEENCSTSASEVPGISLVLMAVLAIAILACRLHTTKN